MNLEFITELIDEKIEKNESYIEVTFFELRVERNLSEEDTEFFIRLSTQRLKNLGYQIYYTGQRLSLIHI